MKSQSQSQSDWLLILTLYFLTLSYDRLQKLYIWIPTTYIIRVTLFLL